jgi:hypothetical protein
VQITVSPTVNLYKKLVRYDVLTFLDERDDPNDESDAEDNAADDIRKEADVDKSILNRASVVTVFRREDLGFEMLFTGDAHDQESDIRTSIATWKLDSDPTIRFNVLKVPHHGSNNTTHSQFYDLVRADVYLICGQHSTHGNPRFSSLQAIIEGFRGKPVRMNWRFEAVLRFLSKTVC